MRNQPWDHHVISFQRLAERLPTCPFVSSDHASNCLNCSTTPFDGCSFTGLDSMMTSCEPPSSATTLFFNSTIDGSCSDLKMSLCSPARRTMSPTDFATQPAWPPLFWTMERLSPSALVVSQDQHQLRCVVMLTKECTVN